MHPKVKINLFQVSRDLFGSSRACRGILGITKWDDWSAQQGFVSDCRLPSSLAMPCVTVRLVERFSSLPSLQAIRASVTLVRLLGPDFMTERVKTYV